ncbi:hypothetical protein [Streptomyces bobili]|uniref:hypothetical protein n=1 Tax=Streptomyces bobili TaxID=67280 RepID=UPI0036EC4AC5
MITFRPRAAGESDPAFLAAQAVLVTNYYKLINGRSVFGVVGDGRQPIDRTRPLIAAPPV